MHLFIFVYVASKKYYPRKIQTPLIETSWSTYILLQLEKSR